MIDANPTNSNKRVRPLQKKFLTVQNLCVLIIAAWIIVPVLYGTRDFRYVVVAASALWLIVESAINPSVLLANNWMKITLVGAVAICIVGGYANYGSLYVRSQIGLTVALLVVFIGCQMAIRPKYGFYWTAIVILGLLIFVAITTTNKLAEQAGAARLIAKSSEKASELMSENVGGYILIYFASAMCPILLFLSLKLRFNGFKFTLLRITAASAFLISAVLVFRASYGIAVVAALICCLIVALPGRVNKPKYWLTLMIAGSILFGLKEPIFDQAKSMSKGTPLFRKVLAVEEMSNFVSLGDQDSEARIERYTRSINSFLESPLVGNLSISKSGKHSTLLDMFAQYGAIGGLAMIFALFLPLYHFYRIVDPANKKLVASLALCLFLHAGLNTLQAGSTLAVFIFMPFAISVIQQSTTYPSQIEHEHIIRG